MECIGILERADGLVEHVQRLQPDLVLLDLNMPGANPLTAMRASKSLRPETHFLVLSCHDALAASATALEHGADGYVAKDGEPDSLLEAIRSAMKSG